MTGLTIACSTRLSATTKKGGAAMGDFVTQEQFGQTLALLDSLREERTEAAASRHTEVLARIDALAAQQARFAEAQTKMVDLQRIANGRTGTLEGSVRALPCMVSGGLHVTGQAPCPEPRAKAVNWRHPGVIAGSSVSGLAVIYSAIEVAKALIALLGG